MKITKIEVRNFRQHRALTLDLSDHRADLTILKGRNSAGKTNFLNAVIWAFYGEIETSSQDENQYITDEVVLAMEPDTYESCEVSVELKARDGKQIRITRRQECKKTRPTQAVPYGPSKLTVQTSKSLAGWDVEIDGEGWIERNLPARFKPYFLFDGEKLATFFRDTDRGRIKAAIQEVARIDVLDRMQSQLAERSQDLLQKAGKQTGASGEKLSDQLESLNIELESLKAVKKSLDEELTEALDLETQLDEKFADMKGLEANISRKRQLDQQVRALEDDLKSYKAQLEERLREVAPSVFAYPALVKFSEAVMAAKAAKTLPPPIDPEYLKSILDKGTCLCGAPTHEGTNGHDRIREVLHDYNQVSPVGEVLYEYSSPNQTTLAKMKPQFQLVVDANRRIGETNKRILETREELRTLSNQLEGIDDSQIQDLAQQRRDARFKAERCRSELRTNEAKIQAMTAERHEIARQIAKLSEENAAALVIQKRADFAKELSEQSSKLFNSLNDRVRLAVEREFQTLFFKMIWNPEDFTQVGIDSSYRVSVTNSRGFEELGLMNAGHRLCLAFAFALTLSKTAGLNFPMVVDTPSGRLDEGVQIQLAQVLSEATLGEDGNENHQLVLLMTSSEYKKEVAEALAVRRPLVLEIKKQGGIAELVVEQ